MSYPTAVKPGWQTTEFWFPLLRFVAGIAMIFYEPTREIGLMITGFSGKEGSDYIAARKELKQNGRT